MQFYQGCSDGTFEMVKDWHIACTSCGTPHVISRHSLDISVEHHGDVFEHYFWGQRFCSTCGKRLFYRTKVYEKPPGVLYSEDHECNNVIFLEPPVIESIQRESWENMVTFRIHGDNIVECERIANIIIDTLKPKTTKSRLRTAANEGFKICTKAAGEKGANYLGLGSFAPAPFNYRLHHCCLVPGHKQGLSALLFHISQKLPNLTQE